MRNEIEALIKHYKSKWQDPFVGVYDCAEVYLVLYIRL